MLAKIGFLLLFIVFGVLALLLGMFAPGDARGRLSGIEQTLQGGGATAATAPVARALERVAPATAPGGTRYTLQLGLFPERAEADALTAQVAALQLPGIMARTLPVRDPAGRNEWIVAAGDQDKPEALESARTWLSEHFALTDTRAIQMPARIP